MKTTKLEEKLDQILEKDSRFTREAYEFIGEALEFTMQVMKKPTKGPERHVTGQELLEGIRQFALNQFGPMAKDVLGHWGVRRCEDFGEIVFSLVEKGVLGRTDKDSREDFKGGFDFEEAFVKPFAVKGHPRHRHTKTDEKMRHHN